MCQMLVPFLNEAAQPKNARRNGPSERLFFAAISRSTGYSSYWLRLPAKHAV
jgi:hypothetical protein